MNSKDNYSGAWQDLAGAIQENKVKDFFDETFAKVRNFYESIGRPNGAREEDFWEWTKEELFDARKRAIHKQVKIIQALEESLNNKF